MAYPHIYNIIFNLMEINQQKCKNLIIGTAGIYLIYCVGAVIQQWIMKIPYENRFTHEKQIFSNSNAFILVPSVCAWFIGWLSNSRVQQKTKTEIPIKNLVQCGSLILLTSLAMTRAIYVTNYPLVTLFKSCNLLSVLAVGLLCSRVKEKSQKLGKKNLIAGFIITIGVLLYHFGANKSHKSFSGNMEGVLLLVFSLLCDGFLPDFQAEIKTKYKPTAMEMFQQINKWKTILSLLYAVCTFQIKYVLVFYYQHPLSFAHMITLGMTGALGQIVVYWMINNFKQHIVPFIITTRKIFTVVISIILFKHESTFLQILGIFIVFTTVFYDFLQEIGVKPQNIKEVVKTMEIKPSANNEYEKISMSQVSNELIRQAEHLEEDIMKALEDNGQEEQFRTLENTQPQQSQLKN